MVERFEVSRRDVNFGLLGAAFAALLPAPAAARTTAASVAPRRLFDFAVAGGWHHALPVAVDSLKPGDRLQIIPEFANPHDPNALAVLRADGLMLGYVPRRANGPVADLIRRGRRVTAEIVSMLDVTSDAQIPPDLVFTGFSDGDPCIRLWVEVLPA